MVEYVVLEYIRFWGMLGNRGFLFVVEMVVIVIVCSVVCVGFYV